MAEIADGPFDETKLQTTLIGISYFDWYELIMQVSLHLMLSMLTLLPWPVVTKKLTKLSKPPLKFQYFMSIHANDLKYA